ncbi:MAG: DUF1553 domain-containing protein [Acidobacteria bacterium]|nr:DUF1553 domain-containing protein [Acidobacteriota bacterium]
MSSLRPVALLIFVAVASAQEVKFNRDVRPILSDKCFACHGPDAQNRKTPLRLDTAEGAAVALAGGGKAIVAGDPSVSVLIERVKSDDPIRRMPPAYQGHDKLSDREIGVLERWIEQGGAFEGHWAFTAPVRPEIPKVEHADWVRNPVDAFVMRGLERAGLQPSPEASKERLIRRVTLDLTGLPPTPAEIDAFVSDSSPDAYEKVVDRLLASPQYGERMASDWLDAARYADTNGYQSDGVRSMWRWRDWVVEAFNKNLSFDKFTVWQIAGDLLPNPTEEQLLATAFHRNNRTSGEGGIVEEEFRVEYVADRAETTGTVWLGLTVGCARCHDHKYDPITQKDYYSLFAFFNSVPERGLVYNFGNDGPRMQAPTPEQKTKLAALTEQAGKAHAAWAALAPEVDKAQHAWEKSLAPGLDGFAREGMVARFSLDDDLEVEALTGVDDPKEDKKPSPAQAVYAEGPFGKAAQFDGKRYLDGGSVAGFEYDDRFTVSLWLNADKVEDAGVVSRIQDVDEGSGWGLLLHEGRLRMEFTMRHTDHSMRVETKRALEPGQWHHVALTFEGKLPSHEGLTIWVDGEAWPFEVEWDDLKWPIGYRTYPFRIGAAAGRRFEGRIDEVRLYVRALTPEQIAALGVEAPLQAIAAKPAGKRTPAEALKLRTAFLEDGLPPRLREARFAADDAERKRAAFDAAIPTVMVMHDMDEPRQAYVLNRGAYDAHGEPVSPNTLSALPPLPDGAKHDRLALANWLVDPKNPMPARVTVNRFWQMFFGRGIVKTVEDFGSQGEWPSHPELLDWLAVEFVDSGWDVQHLLKTIVTSNAYRQSSRTTPALLERDPENALIARGPRVRLPAPAIRDQALAASGLLNEKLGGPPVKPYQPAGLWEEVSSSSYQPDSGDKLYRRSLYTYWKRTIAPPAMTAFDASDREVCTVRQTRTNTPLQALNLMNDVTYLEASRKLAERMMHEAGPGPEARIERGFRLATAREPEQGEVRALESLYQKLLGDYRKDDFEAERYLAQGESARDESLDAAELASYAGVASLILNLDETITKE